MPDVRRARAAAQLLHRPGDGVAAVTRHLLAVQAQDLRAARLAIRARTEGLTVADVDAAIDAAEVVVGWLGRGTLHMVAREDYSWLLALTAPTRFANSRRRLGQLGVPPDDGERAVAVIEAALADGPLTRPELAERLAAHGIATEGQATPHLLGLAALRGVAVPGPLRDGRQAFALARDWLGSDAPGPAGARGPAGRRRPAPPDRDAALAELARRYLTAHGPASEADLAAWIGLPLRDARAGFAAIAGEAEKRARPPYGIPPRLLGPFDPYMLGWKDRSFAVPDELARAVHPGGGIVRAVATIDGLVVGTWTASDKPEGFEEELADLERFTAARRP
jgi:hypothetical protein